MTKQFKKQEEAKEKFIKQVESTIEIMLIKHFNDSQRDYEKQAVIEAAQELGFLELAIALIKEIEK